MVMMRIYASLMDGHNGTPTNEKQSNYAEIERNCRINYQLCHR